MQVNRTQNYTANQTHFGTMERTFRAAWWSSKEINNHTYMFRDTPAELKDIAAILTNCMEGANKIDMKIFGCSDMSQFIGRLIAMDWLKGGKARRRLFRKADVELIDINSDVINRAKQHVIGLIKSDFEDIEYFYDFKPERYFKKTDKPYSLKNEAEKINNPSWKKKIEAIILGKCGCPNCCPDWHPVEFYKINDELLKGVNIRQGDIRKDVKNMPKTPAGTRRIIEFSHGWYFLSRRERVKLASNIAEKTKSGDILIMHHQDMQTSGVNKILDFGFKRMNMENLFKFFIRG